MNAVADRGVRLAHVRTWARAHGVAAQDFAALRRQALVLCVSRLLQGIDREGLCPLRPTPSGFVLGDACRIVAAGARRPFGRLEVCALPELRVGAASRPLASAGAFLRAVTAAVPGWSADPVRRHLRDDFHNSFANLLLNHLLARLRLRDLPASSEPAYQGHHTYPFPALRTGPSLDDIRACSNLNAAPVRLPVIELDQLVQVAGDGLAVHAQALGLRNADGAALLPVHPWQLALSPLLRHMLAHGQARLLEQTIEAMPLASQRTCRILATGYDVKLPIDADLTGERRLLRRLNCENATAVSALVRRVVARDALDGCFGGQYDVAALFHPLENLGASLAAIVRAPVAPGAGMACHAAINLWFGRRDAQRLVPAGAASAERFLAHYCRALLHGPLHLLLRAGIATEPHVQNSFICLDGDGLPARLVLRDLDASVLDPRHWQAAAGVGLSPDTWRHMPAYDDGAKRTVYALFYGHLGEVVDFMARHRGLGEARCLDLIEAAWAELSGQLARGAAERARAARYFAHRHAVRVCLAARLRRDPGLQFLPARRPGAAHAPNPS